MPYNNEIIHFCGGMREYIGKLEQSEHPAGEGWIRILDPALMRYTQDEKGVQFNVMRIWGEDHLYRRFVDIYCPSDSLKEIKVLDKNGGLYKTYQKELGRVSLNRIIAPGAADIAKTGKLN